jgi:hypothetical protein
MNGVPEGNLAPPALRRAADGGLDRMSVADVIEWFINYDERTARIRLPYTEQLFQWKQTNDAAEGTATYPFENAEARLAIGVFQAVEENDSEPLLGQWLSDVLAALHEARNAKAELSEAYRLDDARDQNALERAKKLTTNAERRLYLTSCWLEQLCTAEARILGWIYQDLYGKPFSPAT